MINFSELLWKSGRPREQARRRDQVVLSNDFQLPSGLENAPVEVLKLDPSSRLALLTDPSSTGADRLRFLKMRFHELRDLAKLRTIVITSPMPEDGKSTVAMSLATTLAEQGKRTVLLIEGDLHRPSVVRNFGLRPQPGLAECLEDDADPISLVRKMEPLGWYTLQAGTPRGNPTDLLQSEALKTVMERLLPYFEWILIDTPPVLPMTDALLLARQADATLLVVRADRTPREAIEEALTLVGRKHVVGMLLNGAEGLGRLYSQYYRNNGKK